MPPGRRGHGPSARKGWVADVALRRLHAYGFARTTFAELAADDDVPEAELRALFGDEEGLVAELVSPLLLRLRDIATSAAEIAGRGQPGQLQALMAAYLDAIVANRRLVSVVLGDPTAESSQAVRKARAAMSHVRDELARATGRGLEARIRATCALGAVHAAALEPSDLDPATVHDVITGAAVAILLA